MRKLELIKPLRYAKPVDQEILNSLIGVSWFVACGTSNALSKEQALELAGSTEWEGFCLERRNDITGHLASHHGNRESEWNIVVKAYGQFCEAEVFPAMRTKAVGLGLTPEAISQVEWNLLAYLMEKTYESWGAPLFFYKLLIVLRAGALPCAWNGNYPNGELIVF